MNWDEMYKKGDMPEMSQIDKYVNNSLWQELRDFIETNYRENYQHKNEIKIKAVFVYGNVESLARL